MCQTMVKDSFTLTWLLQVCKTCTRLMFIFLVPNIIYIFFKMRLVRRSGSRRDCVCIQHSRTANHITNGNLLYQPTSVPRPQLRPSCSGLRQDRRKREPYLARDNERGKRQFFPELGRRRPNVTAQYAVTPSNLKHLRHQSDCAGGN